MHAVAARARWEEEVTLLKEELGRVVLSFLQEALAWSARSRRMAGEQSVEDNVRRGYMAYCNRTSQMYARLASSAEASLKRVMGRF